MADYTKLVRDFKTRRDARNLRLKNVQIFDENLVSAIISEVGAAQKALGAVVKDGIRMECGLTLNALTLGEANCEINRNPREGMICAVFSGHFGSHRIEFSLFDKALPVLASMTEDSGYCGEVDARKAAEAVIEKLIEFAT
jgi:hypothetical protein